MNRVVVVSHGFQAHYEAGFCNGLADNGVAVTLLGSCTTLKANLRPAVEFLNIRGEQTSNRSQWRKFVNMVAYHAKLLHYVAKHRERTVMIIGLLHPPWLVGIVEGLILRLLCRRLTLTVHNTLPHDRHTPGMRLLYRIIYRVPHALIVHTQATGRMLTGDFAVTSSRVTLMQHGSNDVIAPCSEAQSALRDAAGIDAQRTVLLFFGVAQRYKGLDLLLDACEADLRIHILFAGSCPQTDYGREIRVRLERLKKQGRLTHHDGFVPDELVGKMFRLADGVVLPYRHIDQSGILLLALSLGVPVIATDVGEFRMLLDDRTGVVATVATVESLREAIDRFIANRRNFEGQAIRQRAQRYAWSTTVRPLLELIN